MSEPRLEDHFERPLEPRLLVLDHPKWSGLSFAQRTELGPFSEPDPLTDSEKMHAAENTQTWEHFSFGADEARFRLEEKHAVTKSATGVWGWLNETHRGPEACASVDYYYLYRALIEIVERRTQRLEGCAKIAAFAVDGMVTRELTAGAELETYLDRGFNGTQRPTALIGTDPSSGEVRVDSASVDSIAFYFGLSQAALRVNN